MEYPTIARRVVDHVVQTQAGAIEAAADLVATAIRAGAILHAFGTGHARIVAHELSGRAGGLVPVNLVSIKDLVMFGGQPPADILDPTVERDPALAARVYELAAPKPADVFLIASQSGINGSVVQMARLVTDRGHALIAITSLAHSRSVPSRHESGTRLGDHAHVVIDTGAPVGDAAVTLPDGTRSNAVSSLAGVLIAQMLTERVCRLLLDSGMRPPVYTSMNVPGGDSSNAELIAAYTGRVRPIEP
ncbi:sugar isomerase domain-containing protein [Allorhizocola rhizosphaerae]|uniref:sugar isomerase domain-containing protein n=1 Tax=Allorhizocola rhizosphaerae TaxID=1872709 RepID=UPI000E3DDFCF|nr:SIS domain-containing protein [Allorhizocola rhizosphaerae]